MDLSQTKLNFVEWNSIEIPVSSDELTILDIISKGYHDINIIHNTLPSLYSLLKLQPNDDLDTYLYNKYLKTNIDKINKKYNINFSLVISEKKTKIKKADEIRIESLTKLLENNTNVYEYMVYDMIKSILKTKSISKKMYYYYTIIHFNKLTVLNINKYFQQYVDFILDLFKCDIPIKTLLYNSSDIIEKNEYIYKYQDTKLYDHQKELYITVKSPNPKLILYKAPTGTGKTMSPLGISEGYKIIFVCAARHVGLALAKAGISKNKRIAFSFGCNDIEDVKLHYFAASSFIKDRRSGSIRKVDNSYGEKVEIMISDIKSYPSAMNYMLAFNKKEDIILYWDEPTISLDYGEHDLHKYIKNIWKINQIPNIVLSSATFPNEMYINECIDDFKNKYMDAMVKTISSHDFKKTIPVLNKNNFIEVPHTLCKSYTELVDSVNYCMENMTTLRYLDIEEIIKFVKFMDSQNYINERYKVENHFESIDDVTISNIKLYYLLLLKNITEDQYNIIYDLVQKQREAVYKSTINLTTTDSNTLTHGPTIYMTNDVKKIGKYCLQITKIPVGVLEEIKQNIEYNNALSIKIKQLEHDLDDGTKKDQEKEKKISEGRIDPAMKELTKQINALRMMSKQVELHDSYVPNKKAHIELWNSKQTGEEFTSDINDEVVEKIMMIDDVDGFWKLLLLMGIGVFDINNNKDYIEIMKYLAQQQKLFMIIASTDYIYGTNYQFCHGYIGKDLDGLTQEKTIQALGRIGRGKLQQNYTLRFRDDNLIKKVFIPDDYCPEIENINKLFISK
tara:strand:+ start:4793 stop:7165 length:2373 start_codon:yes stop_codon:yes gene_type:complete